MKNNYSSSYILGIRLDRVNISQVLDEIKYAITTMNTLKITAINPYKINSAYKMDKIASVYNKFDIIMADSIGVLLSAKILGFSGFYERISGDILAPPLYQMSQCVEMRYYFIGAKDGVADQASKELLNIYPWLKIVGTHSGYFNKQENSKIIADINKHSANIIFVGLGSPYQERWIIDNSPFLPPAVFVVVGGYFDHVINRVDCYPRWIYDLKLNWLYRLWKEPKRLWKRYLIGNPLFLYRVFKQRFKC